MSSLALVVSLAALIVTADAARGDRQDRFDQQKAHCINELEDIAEDAEQGYLPYQELVQDRVLAERILRGPNELYRACVLPGVVPGGSELAEAGQSSFITLDVLTYPLIRDEPDEVETDAEQADRENENVGRIISEWLDYLDQVDLYVRALPGVHMLPWVEREVPPAPYVQYQRSP